MIMTMIAHVLSVKRTESIVITGMHNFVVHFVGGKMVVKNHHGVMIVTLWIFRGDSMTNYEAMRTMDKDELTEFLSSIMDGEAMRIMDKDELAEFLSIIMDCKKCPASEKLCDEHCDDAILNWLNAESNDDTFVEHSEGQTINISHANVVIFD